MIFNFFFLTLFLYLVVFYNFPISDEWFGTNEKMLEMVKTLVFSLNYGKAAVHCHGGIGRTGK
jgi:protein-tyrosine phosphatase